MKTTFTKWFILAALVVAAWGNSVVAQKSTVAVLNIDTKGLSFDPVQMGNLVRLELEKLDIYAVLDRYDLEYQIEKNDIKIDRCYGTLCLTETGKVLGVDKMFSGNVELAGDMILVQYRLIDVNSGQLEKTIMREYLNLPKETREMVTITLQEMFDLPTSSDNKRRLTRKFDYESVQNNPDEYRLALDGPRMGFTIFTGLAADRLRSSRTEGGYDATPVMFQFGYQFEKQYLNEGRWQALFNFIPMITGIDQQLFIPSFTIMNGFRDNYKGWEIAFGPTFNFIRTREWYEDSNGTFYESISEAPIGSNLSPISRLDSRGMPQLTSGFIIAAGRTFKSGHLNIPVNVYVIPNKSGARYGFSFGFNAKNKRPVPQL